MSSISSSSGLSSPPITNLFSNSGMDIETIIAHLIAADSKPISLLQQRQSKIQNQQKAYQNVQTKVQTLLDKIRVLTKRDILTGSTIFESMKGTSSDSSIATATATGSAAAQTLNLEVISLPTATRAVSQSGVGKMMDASTTLSDLGLSDGSFTVFIDGVSHSIQANAADTVGDVLARIQAADPAKITGASVGTDGKIQITYAAGANVSFGAAGGDTSTFLSKVGLLTAKADDMTHTMTASKSVSLIDLSKKLSDPAANLNTTVTDGTFTINGVTFDTTGKSLADIITEINNSADAKVSANFNAAANKLELTAKTTGSTYISLSESAPGNFLSAMGLINGGDSTSSQTAGANAEFVLNGVTMYSTTATADETVTGLTGVTLNLSKAQPGSTIQITVGRDTDTIISAIKDVIDAYNTAITFIDQQIDAKNNGVLAGENGLKNLRNQIRSAFAQAVGGLSGTAYDSLQQVGITTGAPQTGGSVTVSTQLQFDTEKFKTAMETSPDIVKKLFIAQDLVAGSPNDDNMDGIFTQLQNMLSDKIYKDANGNDAYGALYNGGEGNSGLFASYQSSVTTRLKNLDESINRAQDRLANKEALLRKQFTAMDQLIGKYQAQGAAVTNLINQLSASNKS
jgi:flagellar hook-associated protein 2